MELTGTVERIIYENIETGFSIFILSDKNTSVTIRGTVASLYVGQEITIKGALTSHPKFGKQFEAQECICAPPASINGLKKYFNGSN